MNEISFVDMLLNRSTFTSFTVHFSGDEFLMLTGLWFKLLNVSPFFSAFNCTPDMMCSKTSSCSVDLLRLLVSKFSLGTIIVNGVSENEKKTTRIFSET